MESNPILLSELSLDSDIPLYSQIVNIVKRNLSAGTLTAGELLPSEAELCRAFVSFAEGLRSQYKQDRLAVKQELEQYL